MLSFPQLQQLIRQVCGSNTPFYRNHYGGRPRVETLADWQKLPPVTKDHLRGVPMESRTFIPLEELDHLRTSSGTSGGAPVFCPRTHVRNMDYRLEFHDFKNPFMAFSVPMMPHWHQLFQKEHGRCPSVLVYDPANPAASAKLAKAAGVDAFSVFVYHVAALGEAFQRENIAHAIRYIEVTGETCSKALYDYMHATFPRATIVQSYGASEVEDVHIGMPCKPMDGTEPLAVYHPKETHYLEILDENGHIVEPRASAEGTLLITAYAGEPSAFPLIRFNIGDTVRIVESDCAKHGVFSFTVLGRTALDFLKIQGGVLRADEMARVLRLFADKVTDRFEMHRFEDETPDGPKVRVELHVEPRGTTDVTLLAGSIAAALRVNPSRTYAQGVIDGMYLPLTCIPLPASSGGKTKRLIAH